MTAPLRWRDRLQTRIFVPIAVATVAMAAVMAGVAIYTIEEEYQERLTDELLSQKAFTEQVLGGIERRLSLYARSMADAHGVPERDRASRMPGSIPRTVLESLKHDGMTVEYHPEVPATHPSSLLMQQALSTGRDVATGLVVKQESGTKAYFLEGVAPVLREAGLSLGIMTVDLRLSNDLLARLQGERASLSLVGQGELVASTLEDEQARRWVVEQAGNPETVRTVIGEGGHVIASCLGITPPRRFLFAPFAALSGNTWVLAYDVSLEPLLEVRRRILRDGLPAAGLGLLVIFGVYSLFIRRVTRPLRQLSEATMAVASGNLDTRLTTKAVGEMRTLADGFTQMVEDLRVSRQEIVEWNRRLEERVAERTRQLQEVQDQLVQAGKLAAIGELAPGLAHELRNPLAVIRMSSNYLAKKLPPNEKTREHVKILDEEIERIDRLIGDLLELGRPQAMQFEPTVLSDLVERSIALTAREINSRGIKTEVSLDPSMPTVMLDPNQMRQVLINLILNACQAMPNGGTLKLKTAAVVADGQGPSETVRVEVADSGTGIELEHLEKVFKPFFTTKDSGIGLGLSVSQSIVRAHQGQLEVTSHPGEGTTFMVTVPIRQTEGTDHA